MAKEWLEKFKLPIALSIMGIVLIVGGVLASGLTERVPSFGSKAKPKEPASSSFPKESLVQPKTLSVDVSGAVNKPGVYQLKEGSLIQNAIAMAGGFADSASKEYISKTLNLAQKLSDGSKIYIPLEGEQVSAPQSSGAVAGASTQAQVNINTASESDLDALPGIGPVTASKIISSRPYQTIDDLVAKKVVSASVFAKIKDQITTY